MELGDEGHLGRGVELLVGPAEILRPLGDDLPDVVHHVGVEPVGKLDPASKTFLRA